MSWKKPSTTSNKETLAALQQEALDSQKKLCDLWQSCSANALAKAHMSNSNVFFFFNVGIAFLQSLSSSLPEKVLRTALALYMYEGDVTLPLPTHEEVLICNQTTTTEEVSYLISFLGCPLQ